ncbi:hypothetical protein [Pseudoxanthomonas putridarboris]|uniref:Uncharacterized protein n=1 Tax=Pseudoxanthomonas putridarboris TaxID=752605 RepID=A0ABU9IY83_9GAMM
MDCRRLLVPAAACLLLAATLRVRAEDAPPLRALQVQGRDFPSLTMEIAPDLADAAHGLSPVPGCDRIRVRRLDELAPDWRRRVHGVQLDCDTATANDAGFETVALSARALLRPGQVELAGHPVTEVRLMDSELWGDHQYIVDAPYGQAAESLRRHVEASCRLWRLREETDAAGCTMSAVGDGLFLSTSEIGGIWIHPDPENARRTVYAEAWAD